MRGFVIFTLALLMIISAGAAYAKMVEIGEPRQITVTGEAQVNVVPDEVIVTTPGADNKKVLV